MLSFVYGPSLSPVPLVLFCRYVLSFFHPSYAPILLVLGPDTLGSVGLYHIDFSSPSPVENTAAAIHRATKKTFRPGVLTGSLPTLRICLITYFCYSVFIPTTSHVKSLCHSLLKTDHRRFLSFHIIRVDLAFLPDRSLLSYNFLLNRLVFYECTYTILKK